MLLSMLTSKSMLLKLLSMLKLLVAIAVGRIFLQNKLVSSSSKFVFRQVSSWVLAHLTPFVGFAVFYKCSIALLFSVSLGKGS